MGDTAVHTLGDTSSYEEGAKRAACFIAGATACSAAIIQFTVPQVVTLSKASGNPLPKARALRHQVALMSRSLAPQTAITAVQFGLVREFKITLDRAMGENPLHLSAAYGAVSMPFVAAKYNLLIADVYKYHGRTIEAPTQKNIAQQLVTYFKRNIAPGIVWSLLRDSLSVGGAIVMAPTVSQQIVRLQQPSEQGTAETKPTQAQNFAGGLLSGAVCGLGTQIFHNAALTAGRMSNAEGRTPGNVECMAKTLKEHGSRAFYLNIHQRVAVIALWSGILSVTQPFKT